MGYRELLIQRKLLVPNGAGNASFAFDYPLPTLRIDDAGKRAAAQHIAEYRADPRKFHALRCA